MKLSVALITMTAVFSFSCSLDYGKEVFVKDKIPEFIFINSSFARYENNKKTAELSADRLEQYKSDNASFASNTTFTTWSHDGTIQTEGKCGLLGMDTKNEIYSLFNDIEIKNSDPKLEINAQNLKWNAKTEQLASGKSDTVRIFKNDVEVSGKGFSASSITNAFKFESETEGTIIQQDSTENAAEEGAEQ
ncbi:LPS export ABC transporter periplasmic protein LptC [Treponema sp.]|uniref:LPS export ABC transporter periplasmic protein LptC n=1 Tax=Treponema sp. TaxID=166 RepID=UPI00257B3D85|nr:LPS export ABC transporter periplasmic protein LptC [Treponema sp.]MBE6353104.1 LPS export ABC transporter periplasmic protein LptC [Treponema sp.]